jgi:2-polyprenyl-6-methoxyphenol hydroxylase-like FAD-dependent oxidoreductase
MSTDRFDAIVVGARCAGAPTAMLLARKGYRVLVVDRATFPSDTISTHLVHPPGVAALRRWGLLEQVVGSECPAIHRYAFDVGPFVISGTPGPEPEAVSYAPRRTVLDKLLVDAAANAGAAVREAFTVDDLVWQDGAVAGIRGRWNGAHTVTEHARVVIGADGLHSTVAQAVSPDHYNERPPLQAGYYSYWSGLPMHGSFEGYDRGDRAFAAWPTNDDLTLIVVSWPYALFESHKRDIERHFLEAIDRAPALASRLRTARREERFLGAAVPNYFRKPYGPGWALVGDAGYNKDFITAQGISDAFLDAERCVEALDQWLSGRRSFEDALAKYQSSRDEHARPIYDFTAQFASLSPPPPEMQQLLAAIHGDQESMDGFVRVFSGVVSPAEFFHEDNVGRIFGRHRAAPST